MRDKPSQGQWDLKMRRGGLIDLEFITQHAILTAETHQDLKPQLRAAHQQLHDTGVWSQSEYDEISEALTFLQALQQVQRMAHDGVTASQDLSKALKNRLCRATASEGFDQLSERLEAVAAHVTDIFQKKVGFLATES